MKIGFFGGTFNPVHCGHLQLAEQLRRNCGLDEVWLSLSPQNPLKDKDHPGATDNQRAEMLELACRGVEGLRAWTGELEMPRPSYTFNVLERLRDEGVNPTLIIGADNWLNFGRWYRAQDIIDRYGVIVYPRPGYPLTDNKASENVTFALEVPQWDVSSTQIRDNINRNLNLLPQKVAEYIQENSLYGYKPTDK